MFTLEKVLKERAEFVNSVLRAACENLIGRSNCTEHTLSAIKRVVETRILRPPAPDDFEHVAFHFKEPGIAIPANFYTALRLFLPEQPPSWEALQSDFWISKDGILFEWKDNVLEVTMPDSDCDICKGPLNFHAVCSSCGGVGAFGDLGATDGTEEVCLHCEGHGTPQPNDKLEPRLRCERCMLLYPVGEETICK